jgi:hypothetical protein
MYSMVSITVVLLLDGILLLDAEIVVDQYIMPASTPHIAQLHYGRTQAEPQTLLSLRLGSAAT